MASSIRQTNFSAGELDPKLCGRTDLAVYANGLRRMRNFFASKTGAAVSRPGSLRIASTKTVDSGSNSAAKLVAFNYSDTNSYALEFGNFYIRFYSNGEQLQGTYLNVLGAFSFSGDEGQTLTGAFSGATAYIVRFTPGGTIWIKDVVGAFVDGETVTCGAHTDIASGTLYSAPMQLTTIYNWFDLQRLQLAQTGDIMTMTHPSYAPMELRRLAADNWTIAEVVFDRPSGFDLAYLSYPLPVPTLAEPARNWTYGVTAVLQDKYGNQTESTMFVITQTSTVVTPPTALAPVDSYIAVYQDLVVRVCTPSVGVGTIPDGYTHVHSRIYRGRGGIYGWIGDLDAGEEAFYDVGEAPNYEDSPPKGRNPFNVYEGATLIGTEHPNAVAFFQERRCFGGTSDRPGWFFASATGDYANFDQRLFQIAGDAVEFELASRRREEVRSLLSLGKLLIFTNSSIWSVSGQQGSALDFESVDAKVIEEIGTSYLRPLSIDGCALYARIKGFGVRALIPGDSSASGGGSGYKGVDLSAIAQHLFVGVEDLYPALTGQTIVDWAYAEDPWGVMWAVRADGKLLSLTFSQSQETWAWALHETDGYVESICAVPETTEDALYLVVRRTINGVDKRYVERMTSRMRTGSVEDDACVDCGLRYSGAVTSTFTGLDYLEAKSVYFIAKDNSPQGPYTVTGGSITLEDEPVANDGSNLVAFIGLLFTPQLQTLDLVSGASRLKRKTVTRVGLEVDGTQGLWVGQDLQHMKEWQQRDVSDSYDPLVPETTLVTVRPPGRYDEGAPACLEQRMPLPVTVVGLTREVDGGD